MKSRVLAIFRSIGFNTRVEKVFQSIKELRKDIHSMHHLNFIKTESIDLKNFNIMGLFEKKFFKKNKTFAIRSLRSSTIDIKSYMQNI